MPSGCFRQVLDGQPLSMPATGESSIVANLPSLALGAAKYGSPAAYALTQVEPKHRRRP